MRLLELGMGRMAKSDREGGFWPSMMAVNLYKRNQGKLARQLTAGAILVAVVLAAWSMSITILAELPETARYAISGGVALIGAWFAFRIVNYPVFADFLIDVEGEMVKVSWPSKDELIRATTVVLATGFLLAMVLFIYDVVWQQVLRWINVLQF
jgi:preprotein translocase subunit SecE